jgi:ParB family chromosome partitioning protein
MKGRDILKSMVVGSSDPSKADGTSVPLAHRPSGAVRAMNLSLNRLGEDAATAKALRDTLASGIKVVELDPATIEISFIRDRIPVDRDPELDALELSMRESGQQVPILVRPHPTKDNVYQAAYGHRRLRAAANIGISIKAIVRSLTDEELVLAQGQENGARVDLSFIERALFARRMEEHGFDRDVIAKALAIDKPETSRLLQVAQNVPSEIILAIGPAPKVGRPRWLSLAGKLKDDALRLKAVTASGDETFLSEETNKRFEYLWKTLEQKVPAAAEIVRTRKGTAVVSLVRAKKTVKITVTSPAFANYLAQRMGNLVAEFEAENEG